MIRLRGRHRFAEFTPNDLALSRRRNAATGEDQWTASITLRVPTSACARQRTGDEAVGVDFGLAHWANFDDGSALSNPRWLREALPRLADLQRQRARKRRGSHRYRLLSQQIARLHQRIADRRRDFIHRETSALVQRCALIATEELAPKNMSRSAKGTVEAPGRRVRQKAGLNREILSAGFGMAHQMLQYKAAEAGTRLHLAFTRQLKPSQRCSGCWAVVPKTLNERWHLCPQLRLLAAEGSEQCQGRVARRLDTRAHAWDGRGGETQASARASGQAQVEDPRNPYYNRNSGLVAGKFIKPRFFAGSS
nr:transposase [Pseudomonas sp. NW5]